jgi:hypothetical protein
MFELPDANLILLTEPQRKHLQQSGLMKADRLAGTKKTDWITHEEKHSHCRRSDIMCTQATSHDDNEGDKRNSTNFVRFPEGVSRRNYLSREENQLVLG